MDFELVSDELFAAKREDFTALRDERAKQARPDRAVADRISGLRKPTVAAWLVNQVSRNCPEEIDQLAELGESLRRAHQQLAGPELRTLSRRRHELIEMLNKRAQWLARKAAYTFSDATGRQIDDTFEAAVSDEQALEAVRAARLSAALAPGSPEQWLTAAVVPAKAPSRPKKTPPPKRPSPPEPPSRTKAGREKSERASREETAREQEKAAREEERQKAVREQARQEAEDAAKAQDEAEQVLSEAERRAEDAAATIADLRAQVDKAIQAERGLRAEVAAARKALTAAQRGAKAAEKRASDLD